MISIASFLPGLREDDAPAAESAADETKVNPFPHGPVKFRTTTAGQWRRRQARSAAAQKRKTNRRFRREWMRNERAFNTLRSQLVVVGALPGFDGKYADPGTDLGVNVVRHIVEAYGSVHEAVAYYEALEAERAA